MESIKELRNICQETSSGYSAGWWAAEYISPYLDSVSDP